MNHQSNLIERVNSIIKNSVTLKLVTITILMLLLLIPAFMIESIIQERADMKQEASNEVSAMWAASQQISGPILTIPVLYESPKEENSPTTKYWHVLPEHLEIQGNVIPKTLKRGIYEVIVYRSRLDISGAFSLTAQPDQQYLREILYDKAFLTLGISDLRGITNQIKFKWNTRELSVQSGTKLPGLISSGVTMAVPPFTDSTRQDIPFNFSLDLQGSNKLSFIPVGSTTDVRLTSSWPAPSFNGNFLPDTRKVEVDGFEASWSVLQLNRNYPQNWIGDHHSSQFRDSAFGVNMIVPVGDHQKTLRSAKYAVMTIALTFLVFFLVEILTSRKIHPFQYALVGLALCLFFILLVSISEHLDFNLAYITSSLAVTTMISLYSLSVFNKLKLSLLLMAVISTIYGFLFVTLQLADYALLMGSLGLSIILGLTMYFTRNINWYHLNVSSD